MQPESKPQHQNNHAQPAHETARPTQSAPSAASHGQTSAQPAYMSDTQFPTHDALSHIYNRGY